MLKPRCTGTVLDRRHGPFAALGCAKCVTFTNAQFDELLEPSLRLSPREVPEGPPHKPEAILLSLTPLVFERFFA